MSLVIRKSIVIAVKSVGLMAIMFALVASLAAAPSASASTFSTSDSAEPVPVVQELGKVSVALIMPTSNTVQATVSFYDQNGDGIIKVQTTQGVAEVKLPQGVYTMQVSASGYKTYTQEVKVAANETTELKVTLRSDSVRPTSR